MIYNFENTKDFLQSEFDERLRKNPRYSLRAYSAFLGLNAAELSQVFKQTRHLSYPSAQKVIKAYGFNNDEARYFLWLLQKEKGKHFGLNLEILNKKEKPQIKEAEFAEISTWYHFAILNLIDTQDFIWSSQYVASRLGLSLSEAGLAMRDLQKYGFVQVTNKKAQSKKKSVQISSQIPSSAIRTYHKQMLKKANEALDSVPLEQREFQSIGIALREEELKSLKTDIDEFTDKLMAKYHNRKASSVYQIQICLFPLTRKVSSC